MENLMKKIALTLLIAYVGLMASNGAALYKKCATCHGTYGEKSAFDKSGIIKSTDVANKLKAYKDGTLNIYGLGRLMKGQIASYSDVEIAILVAYVKSL